VRVNDSDVSWKWVPGCSVRHAQLNTATSSRDKIAGVTYRWCRRSVFIVLAYFDAFVHLSAAPWSVTTHDTWRVDDLTWLIMADACQRRTRLFWHTLSDAFASFTRSPLDVAARHHSDRSQPQGVILLFLNNDRHTPSLHSENVGPQAAWLIICAVLSNVIGT